MNRIQAEKEAARYSRWNNLKLVHRQYRKSMKVVDIGVAEISPGSPEFFVYCRLEGDLGEVTETIDYVANNYVMCDGDLRSSVTSVAVDP